MSLRHSDVGYQVDVVSPFLVLSGSHYIDENIMAISAFSQAVLKGFDDPETGCVSHDQVAFQSCRQAYFLKQQNQILQNQQQQSNEILRQENTGLKTQAAKIQSELDALKTHSKDSPYQHRHDRKQCPATDGSKWKWKCNRVLTTLNNSDSCNSDYH